MVNENSFFAHESAYVDENVKIGINTKIWHFSHIQSGAIKKWILFRLLFYTFLIIITINCLIFSVAFINNIFKNRNML